MHDWQADNEILRFQSQSLINRHGRDHIGRCTSGLLDNFYIVGERQPIQADHESTHGLIKLITVPKCISDPRGIGIQADIPGQTDVAQFSYRVDLYINGEQVAHPTRDHEAERSVAVLGNAGTEAGLTAMPR